MLTPRGRWLLTAVGLVALVGVVVAGVWVAAVPLLGLSLLAWFAVEWVVFAYRYRATADRLLVTRDLRQGGRTVPAVWAGVPFTVRVTVATAGAARVPFVWVDDRPPAEFAAPAGGHGRAFDLRPGDPAVLEYTLTADAPGVLRFEGVAVRVADLAGLFERRLFLRRPVDVLVLPPLTVGRGCRRGAKRFNTLPPPGVHRLRQPGGGSELLDLREYVPGDPPKMIAWKPSARRDVLIVKELESDVPVRCVLFVDASTGARVGPPGKAPVARLAAVAAGVAQAAAGNRDLVGVTVFDEDGVTALKPARTHVHTVHLLRTLAEAAARLPDPGHTDPDLLARYAHPVAAELYPDLTGADVNAKPLGLYWLPLADSRWFWAFLGLLALSAVLATQKPWIEFVVRVMRSARPKAGVIWADVLAFAVVAAPLFFFPAILALLLWLMHGARGFFVPRRPRTARRKQLGALFAALDGTGPAAVERHLRDDGFFADRATRFLLAHRVRLPLVLTDADGRSRFRSEGKVAVLAAALTASVGQARDNELYVLLADLAELAADLDPLVRAARVARARHHNVIVLVPWPADVPAPTDNAPADDVNALGLRLGGLIQSVLVARYQKGYAEARAALGRAGATVVRVDDGDPVRLVLDRLDRLRVGGRRR